MGHVAGAVLIHHVLNHLVPALVAEVDVKVRHAHPLGVEEALEQQVIADRVHVGDAQAVGGHAARPGAAARPHGDARAVGVADEVPHNEEVVDIAHLGDDAHLVGEPVPQRLAGVFPVAARQALPAEALEKFLVAGAVRGGEGRVLGLAELQLHAAALGDFGGVAHGLGGIGEQGAHLLLGFQVELVGAELQGVLVLHGAPRLDAQQHAVHPAVLGGDVVAVVGAHQGDACLPGEADDLGVDALLLRQAVVLEL